VEEVLVDQILLHIQLVQPAQQIPEVVAAEEGKVLE